MTTDVVEHAGKKGMKWGVRKSVTGVQVSSSAGKSRPEKTKKAKITSEDILNARERQTKRAASLNIKAMETYTQKTQKGQVAAQLAYNKAEKTFLNHPDNKTANKMTKGEKVSSALVIGIVGAAFVGNVALASSYNRI